MMVQLIIAREEDGAAVGMERGGRKGAGLLLVWREGGGGRVWGCCWYGERREEGLLV